MTAMRAVEVSRMGAPFRVRNGAEDGMAAPEPPFTSRRSDPRSRRETERKYVVIGDAGGRGRKQQLPLAIRGFARHVDFPGPELSFEGTLSQWILVSTGGDKRHGDPPDVATRVASAYLDFEIGRSVSGAIGDRDRYFSGLLLRDRE